MDKRTNGNDPKPAIVKPGLDREFYWRLTEKDKQFLRSMNISPE